MGAGQVLRAAGLIAALSGCAAADLRWAPTAAPAAPAPTTEPAPPTEPAPRPAAARGAWWIYAAAGGAVLLGAGLLWLSARGDDVQRFEVSYP